MNRDPGFRLVLGGNWSRVAMCKCQATVLSWFRVVYSDSIPTVPHAG